MCLVREHDVGEDVDGMSSWGSSPASRPVCAGAVEVEADGPVLTVVDHYLLYYRGWPTFTHLQPSCNCREVGCVQDPDYGAPARAAERKL